jgi:pyruvate dehydrogenase E2 component (dihydrolipoamide acetyltransferase)
MGFDMKEGTLVRWLKNEGDEVKRGEAIAEIETDKATVELEAFAGGVFGRAYISEGATVPVGEVIAVITSPGEQAPERPGGQRDGGTPAPAATGQAETSAQAGPAQTQAPTAPTQQQPAQAAPPARREGPRPPVSPVARRIAEEAGVSVEEVQDNVTGTGPNRRIGKEDVEKYLSQRTAAPAPAAAAPQAQPQPRARQPMPQPEAPTGVGIIVPQGLTPMRQAIARRMSLSKLTAPHYYVTVEIDMSRAVELRRMVNEELAEDERISINDMIMKALTLALEKHPHFNVTVHAEGIRPNEGVPISVAVAMEQGLIAPTIPNAGALTLRQIAKATKGMIERARTGKLRPEEMSGVGFTVSNLGMYDVKDFVAIITPPNAGAIAIGSVKPTPVVRDGQVTVAQIMMVTLSADHRATDGAQGAQLMNELRRYLEKPTSLLL